MSLFVWKMAHCLCLWYFLNPTCAHNCYRKSKPSDKKKTIRKESRDVWLLSLTFWKMHRWGKVLEMSSLISSRLDSRSEEPASGRCTNTLQITCIKRQMRKCHHNKNNVVSTFSFHLWGEGRHVPPLLLGSGQANVIQLCRDTLQWRRHRQRLTKPSRKHSLED